MYYLQDVLGSVVAITMPDDSICDRYQHEPHGATHITCHCKIQQFSCSSCGNPFGWTGLANQGSSLGSRVCWRAPMRYGRGTGPLAGRCRCVARGTFSEL